MVVSVALDDGIVCDFRKARGDEAAEGVVIRVDVRAEEFGDEVWFLVGRGAEILPRAVDGGDVVVEVAGLFVVAGAAVGRGGGGGAFFVGHQVLLLRFEGLREEFEERLEGGVEGEVEEYDEDEEDDHEGNGARSGFDAEETDEADDG